MDRRFGVWEFLKKMVDDKDERPVAVRKTLKLSSRVVRVPPPEKIVRKAAGQGDWAAEHKRSMQADMDALVTQTRRST